MRLLLRLGLQLAAAAAAVLSSGPPPGQMDFTAPDNSGLLALLEDI